MDVKQPEGLSRQQTLLLAGKDNGARIAQNPILRPGPVQPFFQMLQRIGLLEPRIQHAMRENKIGRARSRQRAPRRKTVIPPYAIDDHDIEVRGIFAHPRHKPGCVSIKTEGRAQRVNRRQTIRRQPRIMRLIATGNLHIHAQFCQTGAQLPYPLDRTACLRIQ